MTKVTAHLFKVHNLCIRIFKLNTMKKNMGTVDRVIRIIIAAIVGVLYFTEVITGTWGIILLVLSAVFVLTSLISFCPLYAPFGIKTCPISKKNN